MDVTGEGETAAPRQLARLSALAPSGSPAFSLAVHATPITATDATGAASIPTAVAAAAVSAAVGTSAMVGGVCSECSPCSRRAGAGACGGHLRDVVLHRLPCALPMQPQPTPTASGCEARA